MPVIIWIVNTIPSDDPQFHIYEIDVGVGNLIRFEYMMSIM